MVARQKLPGQRYVVLAPITPMLPRLTMFDQSGAVNCTLLSHLVNFWADETLFTGLKIET